MTRTFLIATVAALAITSPAQAERGGDRNQKAERAQKSEKAQAQRGGGQRAERSQQRVQRSSGQRAESTQARASEPRREFRQQRVERRERTMESRARARPQFERRVRETRANDRSRIERRARQVETRERIRPQVERRARQQVERRANVSAQRERKAEQLSARRLQRQERQVERRSFKQLQRQERRAERQSNFERRADAIQPREIQRQRTWEGLSSRIVRSDNGRRDRRDKVRVAIGQQVNPDWFADYSPVRFQSFYQPTRDYYYRYDDDNGYLYRVRRDDDFVSALFPILGGAYSVGRPMPYYYDSYYNVPYGYSSLYYDTPDSYYRYGDGAIYQVDPTTQLISGIVALLTGQSLGIGQTLPMGYDVYNVPYAYRSSYYDTDDRWYRYDDGYIYGVDPRTRLIEASYPVYGGYNVGAPWPTYAGYDYDYAVPDYYGDLYYAEPGYDYRYASNGIYQVDPNSQLIAALVALVTGQNFGVGQRLPLGYDAYNVPFAYRDRYYDNDDSFYRYADGRIYQVDPGTRLIQRVIIV